MPVSGTGPATGSPDRVSNRAPATARRNPASPTGTKPGRTWSPSQTTPTAAGTAVSPTTTAAVVTVTAPRCRPVAKNRNAISAPPTNAYVAGSAIRRPGANPGSTRAAIATTPNPSPATAPSTADRAGSGSRPAANPATPNTSTQAGRTNRAAPCGSWWPSGPAEIASRARPRHTIAMAVQSRGPSRARSIGTATSAVTARLADIAAC